MQNRLMYIELVVVTVVGDGEDVEKSESCWNHAGLGFSTGLWIRCEGMLKTLWKEWKDSPASHNILFQFPRKCPIFSYILGSRL